MTTSLLVPLGFLLLAAPEVQSQFAYVTNNGSITITGGGGPTVVIPSMINGLPVTSIAPNAFNEKYDDIGAPYSLTSVTIPGSVTNIGDYAFAYCWTLGSVTLADGLITIGNGAFYSCEYLANVTIPNSVTSIGSNAFSSPYSFLTSVSFGNSVTNIADQAFYGCKLTSVALPNSLTSIGAAAFLGCPLNSVVIPDWVTNIANNAFAYCTLTNAAIGKRVTSIGDYAFYACTNLISVCVECDFSTNFGGAIFLGDPIKAIFYVPGAAGWGSSFEGIPTTSCAQCAGADLNSGALEVIISPPAAINAGAQWKLDGGAGQDSGVTITEMPTGSHIVSFTSLSGWSSPPAQTVSVTNGATNTIAANYSLLPFQVLHTFTSLTDSYNSDGANPQAGLILSGDTLYGSAAVGGAYGNGTVFAVHTNGSNFTIIHNFSATDTNYSNSDGSGPWAELLLSGNTLYGTAVGGGTFGSGTIFSVHTNGGNFTTIYSFSATDANRLNTNGAYPLGGLVLSGNTLFGTANLGGTSGDGTIFAVNTNGSNFTIIHNFSATDTNGFNSDGVEPWAGLILSGNTLYGTAASGGAYGSGTIFAVNTNGSNFTIIHNFSATDTNGLNNEGAYPQARLLLSGNTLYGTAYLGGSSHYGTVFGVTTNGTRLTVLHSFTGESDGGYPSAGLVLSANSLYGTTQIGGTLGSGTVFTVSNSGTDFTNIYSFSATDSVGLNSDGAGPDAGVILSGAALYGTATDGGGSGNGTVFSFSLPVGSSVAAQADIMTVGVSDTNLVLILTNGQSGVTYYVLMSTNLALPLSQWTPVATNVLSGSGNLTVTVTNTVTRNVPQRFYILKTP